MCGGHDESMATSQQPDAPTVDELLKQLDDLESAVHDSIFQTGKSVNTSWAGRADGWGGREGRGPPARRVV